MDRVNELVDEYRTRCLWFLREDYYPQTMAEALRTLEYIERHGDVIAAVAEHARSRVRDESDVEREQRDQ